MFDFNKNNLVPGVQGDSKRYVNYHHHTHYSNPIAGADSTLKPTEFIDRNIKLGNTIVTTCEHGSSLGFLEYYSLIDAVIKNKYGEIVYDFRDKFKLVYAVEAYFVIDNQTKDKTNAHIVLVAKNDKGRRAITKLCSNANEFGFYNRPRASLKDILSLPSDDVMVTTACFTKGHKVLTKTGYKNIEDVQSGDYVLTHLNSFEKVKFATKRKYNDKMLTFEYSNSNRTITSTYDHKYLMENNNSLEWIEGKDIHAGDCVLSNILEPEYTNINNISLTKEITLTNEDMMALGYIFVNGIFTDDSIVIETKHNQSLKGIIGKLARKIQDNPKYYLADSKIVFFGKEIVDDMLKLFDERQNTLQQLLYKNKEFDCSFILGTLLNYDNDNVFITNKDDIVHFQLLNLYRRYGILPFEKVLDNEYRLEFSKSYIQTEIDINKFLNNIDVFIEKNTTCVNGNRYIKRVVMSKTIDNCDKNKEYDVYCLNVENNHSFNCEDIIVHNCLNGLWRYDKENKFLSSINEEYDKIKSYESTFSKLEQSENKDELISLLFKNRSEYEELENVRNKLIENGDIRDDYNFLNILTKLKNHFKDNLYLEIQAHNTDRQIALNKLIKKLSNELNIKMIAGCDSHLNTEEDQRTRDLFVYTKRDAAEDDESGWYMDYPDYETLKKRFSDQNIFTEEEILEAIDNTLIIETFESPVVNKNIKLPTIYPELTQEERNKKFNELIDTLWEERKKELIEFNKKWYNKEEVVPFSRYKEEIEKEKLVVTETNMTDYFLFNYEMIKRGKEKGGILTQTGRGCFTEKTQVKTIDGLKNISDINTGDVVYNRFNELDTVVGTPTYIIEEKLYRIHYDNTCLELTSDHRVLTNCVVDGFEKVEWKKAQELTLEDRLISIDKNTVVAINKIETFDHIGYVYDLTMKNDPSFIANGVVVHNSGGSFYLNNLLGFTSIDRIFEKVPMLSERFMSKSRILETKSLPDIDFNTAAWQPFQEAQQELLGEHGSYFMITYGQYKTKAAFKMYCRAENLDFKIANDIAKQIDNYEDALKYAEEDDKHLINIEDFVEPQYIQYIEESRKYEGIIDNISPSPCFEKGTKIRTLKGYKNIEDITSTDFVMTHTNNYRRVISPMKKFSEDIYDVVVNGSLPIKVTGEHPFLVKTKTINGYSNPYWKQAKDLTSNDFIARPIESSQIIHESDAENILKAKMITELGVKITGCTFEKVLELQFIIYKMFKKTTNISYENNEYSIELSNNHNFISDEHIWEQVVTIDKHEYNDFVYNMSVEYDESYTANNIVVHNCSFVLLNDDIREEIGVTMIKGDKQKKRPDVLVANITGKQADDYKYLKND